jgi:uncharacterized protein (DUF1800 family)
MASLTYDEAAHLLRRAGFGGSPGEIDDLVARGREGAVDYLINHQQIDNSEMENVLAQSFDFSNPDDGARFNRGEIERWWLTRMVFTRRQFQEKMTLFWHNHFATAVNKVPEVFMFIQNRTLRQHALDRFDKLLLKVAQDPAMLIWLDGISNVRGAPNENFARELQELFSMGINDVVTAQPNYTEQDVKEIARAFTGWKFFGPSREDPDRFNFQFFINPPEHDNGLKTIYGQTANFSGEDIITIISNRRATARFLVKKFFDFFVRPLTATSEDRAIIEQFADVYISRNRSIRELARAIFTSDEFFSERVRFALVKQPVELIIGAIRMLGVDFIPGTFRNNPNILALVSILLGQELFNPPDVAGWNLNLGWINTAMMLNRYTWADLVAISRPAPDNPPGIYLSKKRLKKYTKKNSEETVEKFLSVLGPLQVDADTQVKLREYLESDEKGNPAGFERNSKTIDRKVRGLVHLLMCLSEFQLN